MISFIPNFLSISRIPIGLIIALSILNNRYKLSFFLMAIAALTDFFDGYLARLLKCESYLGTILDPLSDKIFIICLLWVLWQINIIPLWLCGLLLAKDLTMLLIGSYAILISYNIPKANILGKINTTLLFNLFIICNTGLLQFGLKQNWNYIINCAFNFNIVICTITSILTFLYYGITCFPKMRAINNSKIEDKK